MSIFNHITSIELFGMFIGILLMWWLKFNKEKDVYDDKKQKFDTLKYWKEWFVYKWDNIGAHLLVSFSALWIGVDNFSAWMGASLNFPEGVDDPSAAFIIGFLGSYAANILKKGL